MKSYDSCAFERCNIKEDTYQLLQLWLFHTHNSVTERIHNEYESSSLTSSSVTTKSKGGFSIDQVLWPSKNSCPSCFSLSTSSTSLSSSSRYKTNLRNQDKWSNDNVISYLKKSYLVE